MGVATTVGLAVASLVVAAGSSYMQNQNAAKARKQQQNASETAAAQNASDQQASIRQQIRQQRVRTAQLQQGAANTGTVDSSGELGGVSAIGAQTGANVATLTQQDYSSNAILGYQNNASREMGNANTWGAIGGLASTSFNVFSNTPQFRQKITNLFS